MIKMLLKDDVQNATYELEVKLFQEKEGIRREVVFDSYNAIPRHIVPFLDIALTSMYSELRRSIVETEDI